MARTAISGRTAHTNRTAISLRNSVGINIVPNGGFEVYPSVLTAGTTTASRWVDGTASGSSAAKGANWGTTPGAITAQAEAAFDTSIKRSGSASMRLSLLNSSGIITVGTYRNAISSTTLNELFSVLPSTTYTATGYIRTNNVIANGAFIDFREFNSTGGVVTTTSSTKLSGTNTSFRQVTFTVTTNSTTRFGCIFLRHNVAGNIADAWFDDISATPVLGRTAV